MRRVIRGGLLGALPGALLIGVVVILHTSGVITSDQSQIAFLGVPLLFLGLLMGMLTGASTTGNASSVMSGMGLGLAAGVVLAIALTPLMAGSWIFSVPVLMLVGGVGGAWRHEHGPPPPPAIQS